MHLRWFGTHFSAFLFLLQGFASLCTRLLPVKLPSSLLLPSLRLSPNPRTSTCRIWDHATMEPALTSTAWSLRRTFDPHSPRFCWWRSSLALLYIYPCQYGKYVFVSFLYSAFLKSSAILFPLTKDRFLCFCILCFFYSCVKYFMRHCTRNYLKKLCQSGKEVTLCICRHFDLLLFHSQDLSRSPQQRAE